MPHLYCPKCSVEPNNKTLIHIKHNGLVKQDQLYNEISSIFPNSEIEMY